MWCSLTKTQMGGSKKNLLLTNNKVSKNYSKSEQEITINNTTQLGIENGRGTSNFFKLIAQNAHLLQQYNKQAYFQSFGMFCPTLQQIFVDKSAQ